MSVDLSETIPLEVVVQVYDFIDPYTFDGNHALKWLLKNDTAAMSVPVSSHILRNRVLTRECDSEEARQKYLEIFLDIANRSRRCLDGSCFFEVLDNEFDVMLERMVDCMKPAIMIFSKEFIQKIDSAFEHSLWTKNLAIAKCLMRMSKYCPQICSGPDLIRTLAKTHFYELLRDDVIIRGYSGDIDLVINSIPIALENREERSKTRVQNTIKALLHLLPETMTCDGVLDMLHGDGRYPLRNIISYLGPAVSEKWPEVHVDVPDVEAIDAKRASFIERMTNISDMKGKPWTEVRKCFKIKGFYASKKDCIMGHPGRRFLLLKRRGHIVPTVNVCDKCFKHMEDPEAPTRETWGVVELLDIDMHGCLENMDMELFLEKIRRIYKIVYGSSDLTADMETAWSRKMDYKCVTFEEIAKVNLRCKKLASFLCRERRRCPCFASFTYDLDLLTCNGCNRQTQL